MFPLSHMLKTFIRFGTLEVIDAEGERHIFSGKPGPHAVMQINDKSLYRKMVTNPELNLGEGFSDGRIQFVEGTTLRNFLHLAFTNQSRLEAYPLQKIIRKLAMPFRTLHQANRIGQAQRNVAHHYDLGNDFYKLFLDKNMLYSCAYYRSKQDTLEQAQINKLRLLAAKLNLKPGMRVLDIGCGWGAMAIYLASMVDVEVVGVTLSTEQEKLATGRAKKAGLSERVKFKLLDYRKLDEKFDRIVSVGMFEHVGISHYDEFFSKINTLMPDDGLMVLHSIGHMSPPGMTSPWMRKYIFPGAYSPALSEVFPSLESNNLWCLDLEFLRVHYADTLVHWEERFQKNRKKIESMYDEQFARMWEFYLVSAEQMFRTGAQEVFQMQLSRNRDAAPLTRDYLIDAQKTFIKKEKTKLPKK